jgi:hypothetical protein
MIDNEMVSALDARVVYFCLNFSIFVQSLGKKSENIKKTTQQFFVSSDNENRPGIFLVIGSFGTYLKERMRYGTDLSISDGIE